jgi:hypothetical protein
MLSVRTTYVWSDVTLQLEGTPERFEGGPTCAIKLIKGNVYKTICLEKFREGQSRDSESECQGSRNRMNKRMLK